MSGVHENSRHPGWPSTGSRSVALAQPLTSRRRRDPRCADQRPVPQRANTSTARRLRSGHSGQPGTLPGVAAIRTRFAQAPFPCPFCGHIVHIGSVIAQVISGTTVAASCLDCEWAAVNGELVSRARKMREA